MRLWGVPLAFELAFGQAAQPEVHAAGAFLSDASEESLLTLSAVMLMWEHPQTELCHAVKNCPHFDTADAAAAQNHGFGVEEGRPGGGLHHPA